MLSQIVNRHGPEADRHLLRCLFSHVDFSGDGKSSGKDFHQVTLNLRRLNSGFSYVLLSYKAAAKYWQGSKTKLLSGLCAQSH